MKYINTNYSDKRYGVHVGSPEYDSEKTLQRRDYNLANVRGLDFIDGTNGIVNVSIDEFRKIWYLYVENLDDGLELSLEHFINFCIKNGVTYDNGVISFLGTKDSLKQFLNKENVKNNYNILFEKTMGIKILTDEKMNECYEEMLKYISDNNLIEIATDEQKIGLLGSIIEGRSTIIKFYNNFYLLEKDNKELLDKYKKHIISSRDPKVYDMLKNFIEQKEKNKKSTL